jgi:YXWGXW repeat-containing protein
MNKLLSRFSVWRRSLCALLVAIVVSIFLPEKSEAGIYVRLGPPAVIAETPGPRPAPGYIWDPGHWRWNGHKYVWVPGHFQRPPHGRGRWVPGHWVQDPRGWYWVEGRWA